MEKKKLLQVLGVNAFFAPDKKLEEEMKKIIIALLGMAIVAIPVFAATIYISPNGNDINDGSSWALAKQTIQAGTAWAIAGDTILVTNGTYVLTYSITVNFGFTIKSVNGPMVTVINGAGNQCIGTRYPDALDAVIDGFMITGGVGCGGGVFNHGIIRNCIIWGNIENDPAHRGGGGLYNAPSGIAQNCLIVGNTGSLWGGGVYNKGTLRNCTISGNSGGGVVNDGGTLRNCIVYYNEGLDIIGDAQYSCVSGLSGNGNISSAPQFEDPANGNYRLKYSSPCINAGINQDWMAGAVDLDGNPRISCGRVDMGAYEFAITNPASICPVIKANGSTNDITISDSENLSITVQIDPGQYTGIVFDWWIVAFAGPAWYYLNSAVQLTQFDGNFSNCHPVNQGALGNLPATEVLNVTGLPAGSYTLWFAVDYPMNGILDSDGTIVADSVNVTVQ